MSSPNVTWHAGELTPSERWSALGQPGATLWLTGLPSSGKSTVAAATEAQLVRSGRHALRLDADNLRHGFNANLGFSAADRAEQRRRPAHAAALLAEAGVVAVASLVSPYARDRDAARQLHAERGLPFYEIHVATPLEECERRDPKGLYARARAGELSGMTGIDDPYEEPSAPELVLDGRTPIEESVARVLELLA